MTGYSDIVHEESAMAPTPLRPLPIKAQLWTPSKQ